MIGIAEESRRLKEFMSNDPSMVTDGTLGQLVEAMASLSSLSKVLQRFFTDVEVRSTVFWVLGTYGGGGGGGCCERLWLALGVDVDV